MFEESFLLIYDAPSMDERPLAQRCIPEESIPGRQNIWCLF
jgi:hypothetical protein